MMHTLQTFWNRMHWLNGTALWRVEDSQGRQVWSTTHRDRASEYAARLDEHGQDGPYTVHRK